jgi:small-conductance mechanosensitive channel
VISISSRGEKSVMAARRGVRVIVAVLNHRIRAAVFVRLARRCGVLIIAMLIGHLIVMLVPIVMPLLRMQGRWHHSSQREREYGENEWLEEVVTHERYPLLHGIEAQEQ